MGIDFLGGAIVGAHALLGFWIGDRLSPVTNRFFQLLIGLLGFIIGTAFGYGISRAFLSGISGSSIAASGPYLLSTTVFFIPFILILKIIEWRTEHRSRDYQAIAAFTALVVAGAISSGLNYLIYVIILHREVPTSSSLVYEFGNIVGFCYIVGMIWIIHELTVRETQPKDEIRPEDNGQAGGIILLPWKE